MTAEAQPSLRTLLTREDVLRLVPFSYTTLWEMMRRGEFPRSVRLSPNKAAWSKVAWYEDEIRAWIAGRPRQALKGDRPLANQASPRE